MLRVEIQERLSRDVHMHHCRIQVQMRIYIISIYYTARSWQYLFSDPSQDSLWVLALLVHDLDCPFQASPSVYSAPHCSKAAFPQQAPQEVLVSELSWNNLYCGLRKPQSTPSWIEPSSTRQPPSLPIVTTIRERLLVMLAVRIGTR